MSENFVRINRTPFSESWEAVKVNAKGLITQRWPIHPDDAKALDAAFPRVPAEPHEHEWKHVRGTLYHCECGEDGADGAPNSDYGQIVPLPTRKKVER